MDVLTAPRNHKDVVSESAQFPASLQKAGGNMLYYALVALGLAIFAGMLGFGSVAFAAAGVAKILCLVFLIIFVFTMISHLSRGTRV